MPMFLRSQIPTEAIERIDCVESNQGILAAAERFFGFTPNDALFQSHCADALEHIAKSKELYDIIMLDISSLESEDCSPPQPFLEKKALTQLWSLLKEKGVLCINTMIKGKDEKAIRQKFTKEAKALGHCFSSKCAESSNEIVFVTRHVPADRSKQM